MPSQDTKQSLRMWSLWAKVTLVTEGQGEEARSYLHESVASLHLQKEQPPPSPSQASGGHHSQICNFALRPSCDLRGLHKSPKTRASIVFLTPATGTQGEMRAHLFLPLAELWVFLKS